MREVTRTALFLWYRDGGDGQALARLFDELAGELCAVARHLAPSPGEAEDLVATTFLRAMARRADYREDTPVAAWMHGILWREAAQARRRAARRVEPERLRERRVEGPEDALAARELRERLDAALARLPRASAELLRAHLFEQAGAQELAARSGRSPATVRSQLHRALARLRRLLPVGLTPLGGLAPLPVGLTAVRARVLDAARAQGASLSTSTVAATAAWTGVPLMTKSIWIAATTAAVTFVCGWTLGTSSSAPVLVEPATPARVVADVSAPELVAPSEGAVAPQPGPAPRSAVPSEPAQPVQRSLDDEIAYWLGRFDEKPDDWRHGWNLTGEIARLDPERALAVMRGVWPSLSVPVKEQALKPFVFGDGNPAALGVLDLALRDDALSVQGRALTYLEWYAFEDFEADYGAALAWMDTWRDVPVGEVLTANAERLVRSLAGLDGVALDERLREFDLKLRLSGGAFDPAAAMRDAGVEAVLARAMSSQDPEVLQAALRWSSEVQVGEPWLRAHALPIVRAPADPELTARALIALDRPDCAWAAEEMYAYLGRALEDPTLDMSWAARALATYGEPAAVGRLVALMQHDTTGRSTYDIGYNGLGKLTGVGYDESHDAGWWQAWWLANQARFH